MDMHLEKTIDNIICTHSDRIQHGLAIICETCGLVLHEDLFSLNPEEFEYFGKQHYYKKDPLEISHQKFIKDFRLSTSGESPSIIAQFYRFNNINKFTYSAQERKDTELLNLAEQGFAALRISSTSAIRDNVMNLLKGLRDYNNQGRSNSAFICAIFYLAYKNCARPIILKDLKKVFGIEGSKGSKHVFHILKNLYDAKQIKKRTGAPLKHFYETLMNKHFFDVVQHDFSIIVLGVRIANILENLLDGCYNKRAVTAGLCYYVFKKKKIKITQKEIATRIHSSDRSIKKWHDVINAAIKISSISSLSIKKER